MVVGASPKTALDVVKGVDLTDKTAVVTGGNSGPLDPLYRHVYRSLNLQMCYTFWSVTVD